MNPFKSYEEMSQEERDKRSQDAFTWKDGDLIFTPPKEPLPPDGEADFDRYYEEMTKEAAAMEAAEAR